MHRCFITTIIIQIIDYIPNGYLMQLYMLYFILHPITLFIFLLGHKSTVVTYQMSERKFDYVRNSSQFS